MFSELQSPEYFEMSTSSFTARHCMFEHWLSCLLQNLRCCMYLLRTTVYSLLQLLDIS